MLDHDNFELIVMEDAISFIVMPHLVHRDIIIRIPRMGIVCLAGAEYLNDKYGLPGLINSVPSMTNDVTDSSPTFWERWHNLTITVCFFKAAMALIQPVFKDEPAE